MSGDDIIISGVNFGYAGGSVGMMAFDAEKQIVRSSNIKTMDIKGCSYVMISVPKKDVDIVMLNYGSTALPWEPYTGGKPSPSPEYPQEIESAGQSRKIGVTVTGTNLLPFEVGQKGNGFEVFADGVQIDVDKKADIYAVGRFNGNVESGYDEFALMTAGKYYIYSGTQDVYLYVVVWRKGKNVVLWHSVGTDAEQIEIMDGDKFRIFLRTNGAFNGKVKVMISKIQPTTSNYEPYTGGKPSPSPEYPQEIKSTGQSGEIGVEVLGKNLIPFPYPLLGGTGTQIERNGVKYTVQSDGCIRCVGTPTAVTYINLSRIKFSNVGLTATQPTDGKIVLSGEKMTYDPSNYALFIYITSDQLGKPIDTVIYPQIEFGTVATEYEPYRPAQTLIIPTPNGLPGVPTIDNGNYTDASGQQWLCDEVDLKRGVYVQNVAFAEFGKGITSVTKNSGVSSKNIVSAYFFSIPRKRAKTRHTIMSNCLRFVANVSSGNPAYVISNESQTEAMYVSIPAELYENDDQMLNLLAEKKVKILYATYPTERPLSAEELEKYRSLRTYSPTTTVINDAGAGMSVGYKKAK